MEKSKPKENEKGKEQEVGKVSHYYTTIGVAVVELSKALKHGDTIRIKGHTTDFQQKIASMQAEHKKITEAKPKQSVGLKVTEHVRPNDVVYKLG